jgi:glycosyltransferase involved in cell wall biosynthesis
MRALLVSHPALTAELGASQVALNLAAALRQRGHDAIAWSPEPLPADTRWWNLSLRQRRAAERFAREAGPFDLIDTPAIAASRDLAANGPLVVRSVQPELRYLWHELRADLVSSRSPRAAVHAALGLPRARAIVAGWRRARAILCLGSDELAWMRRRFPRWAAKTGMYVCALGAAEQEALAAVRSGRRTAPPAEAGSAPVHRYLWVGRWAAHKGTARLEQFLAARLAAVPDEHFTLAGCGTAPRHVLPAAWLESGRVRLVPSFTRTELPALLAGHDAGLFTSSLEGWGLSLNEMLEAGVTVFATAAGAVADLRPFFPDSLRPFPPPASWSARPLEDLDATGYRRRFSWPEIARSYEEQVLAAGLLAGTGAGAAGRRRS